MVRGVYTLAKCEGAMDVTTEDPSDVFRSLRDTEVRSLAALATATPSTPSTVLTSMPGFPLARGSACWRA
jgi:hypothetical protein